MEFNNKVLSIMALVLIVVQILTIIMSISFYVVVRNKSGPRGPRGRTGPRGPRGPPS